MKPKFAVFSGIGAVALITCVAMAQDSKGPGPGGPGGEGRGPGAGGPPRIADVVKAADTNADGKLSKEEFQAFGAKETEKRFGLLDANTDGVVDEAEVTAAAERMRDRAGEGGPRRGGDSPGQGSPGGPSGSEFRRPPGEEGEGGRRPEGDRREGGPRAGSEGRGQAGGGKFLDEYFGRLDKNSDGFVDKEEFNNSAKQESERRFDNADADKDGKVSKDELKTSLSRARNFRSGQGGPVRPDGGGGEGGVRRPPGGGDRPEGDRPRPEGDSPRPEADTPKKDAA